MAFLIEDTRQQGGKHALKHERFESMGVDLVRCKLPYGDYARPPAVACDTKKDIQELASDMWQQHDRFHRECEGAASCGCLLVIVVENEHGVRSLRDLERWTEPAHETKRRGAGRVPIDGAKLAKACRTMTGRYGVGFVFCAPEESAAMVLGVIEEHERRCRRQRWKSDSLRRVRRRSSTRGWGGASSRCEGTNAPPSRTG